MKRLVVFILLSVASAQTFAQHNPTDPDTLDDKVANQESWYNDTLPKDLEPFRDSVLVSLGQIPVKLRQELQSKDVYDGWENATLYFEKASKTYKLYLPDEKTIRIYGFSSDGHPVSFRSFKRK
jgi:hypothetical protein